MFSGNSSRDLVLKTLFFEWPLTAKEIYSRVSKNSDKDVSYQAIHKMINSLLDEGILSKQDNKYLVSLDWVRQRKDLLTVLETNLVEGRVVSPLEQKIVFETIHEVDQFLVQACGMLKPSKEDELGLVWIHFWIPLFFSRDTYVKMKELILSSNFYCLTPNNTKIDKWCSEFWDKLGIKEKSGVKGVFDVSTLVYKDTIIQVFYPAEIRKALDEVYNSTENPNKLDIDNFFETVFEKKTRIPVLITKNKVVAEELMKQIKSFF